MAEENNRNLDEGTTQEVAIAENLPMIQSGSESGVFNRFRKFSERVGQNQWISEFDLFTTPLKLNYNGQECYKTEFGGIVYLAIGLLSVVFSMMYQFPDGLSLQSPINYYSLRKNNDVMITVFNQTDTLFELYLYNIMEVRRANATEVNFLLKSVYIFQVSDNKSQALNVSKDCSVGDFCLKKIPGNQQTYLNGSEGSNNLNYIQIEILSCGVMDTDPDIGLCSAITNNYAIILEVTSFIQKTGSIQKTIEKIIMELTSSTMTSLDLNIYTTNNNFFGYIANIFSYTLSYYVPLAQNIIKELTIIQSSLDCFDMNTWAGTNACTVKALYYSGTTNIVTQNFDDITVPLLFFLSLSQTLFYLCYIFFLRNYSNNALHLRIADSVIYIPNGQGKHHDFKSGVAVFFACLIYNHNLVKLLDLILYVTVQRQIKKLLPIKVQLTMEMIAYGQSCLGEQHFFNRINTVYQQQNLQPTKLIFDDPEEDKQNKDSQISQKDLNQGRSVQSQEYFEDQIDQEAFKRMCQEHEYYNAERKAHLCRLLKRNDKNFKLVLMVQEQFEEYRRQVKQEFGGKEQTLPIYFNNEEVSAMSLYRSKP